MTPNNFLGTTDNMTLTLGVSGTAALGTLDEGTGLIEMLVMLR